MKQTTKNLGLIVNGEELLALKNLVEQHRAEIDVLKRALNTQQAVIFQIGHDMKSLSQQLEMLRNYVDKKIITRRK